MDQGQPTKFPLFEQHQNKLMMQGASANELDAKCSGTDANSNKQIKRHWWSTWLSAPVEEKS